MRAWRESNSGLKMSEGDLRREKSNSKVKVMNGEFAVWKSNEMEEQEKIKINSYSTANAN